MLQCVCSAVQATNGINVHCVITGDMPRPATAAAAFPSSSSQPHVKRVAPAAATLPSPSGPYQGLQHTASHSCTSKPLPEEQQLQQLGSSLRATDLQLPPHVQHWLSLLTPAPQAPLGNGSSSSEASKAADFNKQTAGSAAASVEIQQELSQLKAELADVKARFVDTQARTCMCTAADLHAEAARRPAIFATRPSLAARVVCGCMPIALFAGACSI